MSSSPEESALGRPLPEVRSSEIEALADRLVALVEEFDAALSEGRVPPDFAGRLTQIRLSAERLMGDS